MLSYSQRILRKIIRLLNSELANLFGGDWHLYFSDLFDSSFYKVFTSRFGETATDQWTSLISFAKDIHNLLFYFNFHYLLLVYRLLSVRMVTSSPKQSVRHFFIVPLKMIIPHRPSFGYFRTSFRLEYQYKYWVSYYRGHIPVVKTECPNHFQQERYRLPKFGQSPLAVWRGCVRCAWIISSSRR